MKVELWVVMMADQLDDIMVELRVVRMDCMLAVEKVVKSALYLVYSRVECSVQKMDYKWVVMMVYW